MDSSAVSEIVSGPQNNLGKDGLPDLPLGVKRRIVAHAFFVSASRALLGSWWRK